MIRVQQIALPLDHPPEALPKAVSKRLKLPLETLGELQLFRRSVHARHKGAIELMYSVDVSVADEAAVLDPAAISQPCVWSNRATDRCSWIAVSR